MGASINLKKIKIIKKKIKIKKKKQTLKYPQNISFYVKM
jgi:hypothetical protein